jgi:EmrB/QacA subfamily drug resistance transporter
MTESTTRTSSDSTAAGERDVALAQPADDEKDGRLHRDEPPKLPIQPPQQIEEPIEETVEPEQPPTGDKPPEAQRTKLETVLIMGALCVALFLAALDTTIVATAIPVISTELNSSLGYIWVGSAFLLGNAAFVPTWGKVSDIFGRKPMLLAAVGIFWVGSLLCGVSKNMTMLIISRAIQGIGAGGCIVLPNICVSDLFSMRNRSQYFAILGMVWAVASALGPVLGGVFATYTTWRWCFYINLPISGVAMLVLVFVLKLHNPRTPMKEGLLAIDWTGSVLIVTGTVLFLLGLEFGGVTYPWASAPVLCLMIFGVFTWGLFLINEFKFAKYPIVPLWLFKIPTSVASYALGFMHAFTFMSGSYWLPLYFQAVIRATPLMSGVYILPFAIVLSLVSGLVGVVIKKTGNYKIPIVSGMAVTVLGFGLFIDLGAHANWAKLIIYQIIAGIGIGPNFQSPLIAIQTNVEPRDIGSATASFTFIRQLGTSVSVVVGGVIFNNEMEKKQGMLQRELGPELASAMTGARAAGSVELVASLEGHEGEIARGAYWNSLRTMYIAYTCTATVGLLLGFFIRQNKLRKDHQEHKTGLTSLKPRSEGAQPADEEKAAA